ncbi:hypothetical protein N7455_000134 [Penicillium solitum]|uniref:uncharacterized protein n=1 Tax=Penicillium solitum TaxID=60172 RepID=UPI0032C4AB3D|nr:hypothetical protein N7455_000134 [Penicillium solitum]
MNNSYFSNSIANNIVRYDGVPDALRPLIASDGIVQNYSRLCTLETTFDPTAKRKETFAPRNQNPALSGIISPLI